MCTWSWDHDLGSCILEEILERVRHPFEGHACIGCTPSSIDRFWLFVTPLVLLCPCARELEILVET